MKGTQIDMKKKRFATIVAALLVISLASCSTPAGSLPSAPDGSHVPEKTQALYSNLTDDSSRREVVDALQATAYLRSRPIPCWPGQTTLTPG